jgi:hypothetical protein
MIYTVSYVVVGGDKNQKYPSSMLNQHERPKIGDQIRLGDLLFEVTDVQRMVPASDDFEFIHATVRPLE